jgi:antitoxin FitA
MATLTIRKLPDETHRALKSLAIQHGRSAEAEVRHIIEQAVSAEPKLEIREILKEIRKNLGDVELNIQRDQTPIEYAIFE